jgi:hypothetical protein
MARSRPRRMAVKELSEEKGKAEERGGEGGEHRQSLKEKQEDGGGDVQQVVKRITLCRQLDEAIH